MPTYHEVLEALERKIEQEKSGVPLKERTRQRMVRGMRQAEENQREAILAVMAEANEPVDYVALSYTLDLNPQLIRTRVQELVDEGRVVVLRGDLVELGAAHRRLSNGR